MRSWPAPGRVAVLRGADQTAGRAPTHCVKSGRSTSGAVTVRAASVAGAERWQLVLGYALTARLGRSRTTLLRVAPDTWRSWRRAHAAAIVVSAIGAGLALNAALTGQVALGVVSVLVVLAGQLGRARMAQQRWVGLRYDVARDVVRVSRVSQGFDDDARAMFVRGLS